MVPLAPCPASAAKSATAGSRSNRSAAAVATARAIGCSDASSTAPARRRTWSVSAPSSATTSTRVIRPVVSVPVLSRTTVSTFRVDSSTCGPRMRIPSWAPRPVPAIRAVGVARPSAHGQAMTRTETAATKAVDGSPSSTSQATKVSAARPRTRGTNTAETRSARRCTGALPSWAASTRRPIRARRVSAPTRVARTTSRPPALTVAPRTVSPGPTSTGTDSPVSIDSSTAEEPSSTAPSVATFSPGRTTKRVPGRSAETGTRCSRSWPSASGSSTDASSAPASASARSASPASRVARPSAYRPERRNVVTTAAISKYSSSWPRSTATTDQR